MTTGEKIYELRKKARVTQEEFAQRLGVSRQAVSKWESDAAYPETENLIAIADMFGVSCDYLLKEDCRPSDNLLERRRRDFLTMMNSFAIACAIVGFIIAVVCYYTVSANYPSLVGLGILAGFALAAFVTWSIGRYRFLADCDYLESDKKHLARCTKTLYYTIAICLFCYLPFVAYIPVKEITVNTETLKLSQIVNRYVSFGEYILLLTAYAPLGIAVAAAVNVAHEHALGRIHDKSDIADRILAVILFATLAIVSTLLLYVYNCSQNNVVLDYDELFPLLPALFTVAAAIDVAYSAVHRIYDKTTTALFAIRLVGCILIPANAFNCMAFVGFNGLSDIGWFVTVILSYVLGALLFLTAIAQTVLTVVRTKHGESGLIKNLILSLALYAFLPVWMCMYYWTIAYFTEYGKIAGIACVCCLSVIVALVIFIPFRKREKESSVRNSMSA